MQFTFNNSNNNNMTDDHTNYLAFNWKLYYEDQSNGILSEAPENPD